MNNYKSIYLNLTKNFNITYNGICLNKKGLIEWLVRTYNWGIDLDYKFK